MNKLVFDNEIILYWDRPSDRSTDDKYLIYLNGEFFCETKKTHYTFYDLKNQKNEIKIIRYTQGKEQLFYEEIIFLSPQKRILDVTKKPYNAVGDGKTLDTFSIQKALDDCGENDMVYLPKGVYLCGALNLHSNTELYIEKDAVLQGVADVKEYEPKILSRFEGIEMPCYRSLLNMGELDRKGGYNCKNVVIRGGGTICGGGEELRVNTIETERERLKDYIEALGERMKEYEKPDTLPGRARGRLINVSNAQNVVISDLLLEKGPSWNVHLIYSDNVVTANCSFRSRKIRNGDGWDPDSSTNCTIFNCDFCVGDDSVAIKSGKNPEGNIINRPCENIAVFDCKINTGISIGSEMSGGVKNVKVWDCDLSKACWGFNFKVTQKRGGYIKDVTVFDCVTSSINVRSSINFNNDGEGAKELTYLENFHFENIRLTGEGIGLQDEEVKIPILHLEGFSQSGHELKNVTLKNISIPRDIEGDLKNFHINNVDNLSMTRICSK